MAKIVFMLLVCFLVFWLVQQVSGQTSLRPGDVVMDAPSSGPVTFSSLPGFPRVFVERGSLCVDDHRLNGVYLCTAPPPGWKLVQESAQAGPVPISWCDVGGERWGESGLVCHLDPAARRPPMCLDITSSGELVNTSRACSIPAGFERAGQMSPLSRHCVQQTPHEAICDGKLVKHEGKPGTTWTEPEK